MKRRCRCQECGRTLRAPIEVKVLFHDCPDPWEQRRRRRRPQAQKLPEPEGITLEEVWYDAFASVVHPDQLLRRVEG